MLLIMIGSMLFCKMVFQKWVSLVVFVVCYCSPVGIFAQFSQDTMPFPYNALEPYLDAKSVEHHYQKYHADYVNRLNNAFAERNERPCPLEYVLQNALKYNQTIRNNAGGHYNHTLFWSILGEKRNTQPDSLLSTAIVRAFGSIELMKEYLRWAAKNRFGSGWVWLVSDSEGDLYITSLANEENPLMETAALQGIPILAIDVWEHAYFGTYGDQKMMYIDAVLKVIDWEKVSQKYALSFRTSEYAFQKWPELWDMAQLIRSIYHPFLEENFEPMAMETETLASLAERLSVSKRPEIFQTTSVDLALKRFLEGVKTITTGMETKTPTQKEWEMRCVHATWRELVRQCRLL